MKKKDVIIIHDYITSIVLDIDSPGGTVDGILELADIIFKGRDKKCKKSDNTRLVIIKKYLR